MQHKRVRQHFSRISLGASVHYDPIQFVDKGVDVIIGYAELVNVEVLSLKHLTVKAGNNVFIWKASGYVFELSV